MSDDVSNGSTAGPAATALPLAGMRVLDVSQVMAGPFCCMLLGDLGADVVKIEPPGTGDQTRGAMSFRLKGADSLGFINMNRNKRSVALDLKTEPGRRAFHKLVETADVLVENYRLGVVKRLGIDYDTLKEINPRLIYASISGFGQTGPWSLRPGFDLIAQAMGGVMSITGHPGEPPAKSGVPVADIGCSLFAVYAILSAYIGRQQTGLGQHIDASLFEAALAFAVWDISEYLGTGKVPGRIGTANRMSAPYQAVRSRDGWFVMGANNDRLWRKLCEVIARTDLLDDPRYASIAARLANREALIADLETTFVGKPSEEWVEMLGKAREVAEEVGQAPELGAGLVDGSAVVQRLQPIERIEVGLESVGQAAVADRMAAALGERGGEAPIVLGNGYGGFVALQMAIRHPGLARRLVLADCGACFSDPGRQVFRAMAAGVEAGGAAKISDAAMRRLFAPDFQDAHPELVAERRAAFLATDPVVPIEACRALAVLDLRSDVPGVAIPVLVPVGERDEATPRPCRVNSPPCCPTPGSRSSRDARTCPNSRTPGASWRRSARFWPVPEPGHGFRAVSATKRTEVLVKLARPFPLSWRCKPGSPDRSTGTHQGARRYRRRAGHRHSDRAPGPSRCFAGDLLGVDVQV